MFSHAYDPQDALLVGVWSGPTNTDADYDNYLAAFERLCSEGKDHEHGVVTLLVLDPDNPRPDPVQRQRIAAAREAVNVKLDLVGLVTTSVVMRGVITAIRWITSADPRRDDAPHATFEEAVRWAERRRGAPLASAHSLYARARSMTARKAG
jgi:hypothetical protein